MTLENESDQRTDEATSPTMDATKRTDNALRDTARTYLRKFGFNLDIVRKIWGRGAVLTSRLQSFETELLTQAENLVGLAPLTLG